MIQDGLEYSFDGKLARVSFYADNNDINIYVEDANKEFEYETIFKRLLGEDYNISSIFAMGGKPAVKKAFQENGELTNGIQNYYVVDGDFDRIIAPDEMIDNSHFIYLETYNIENYYIDELACLRFAKGKLKQTDEDVSNTIKYNYWKETIVSQSSKLFLCYCFLQKYYPKIENVNRKPCLFLDSKTGFERTDGAFNSFVTGTILPLDTNYESKIDVIEKDYKNIFGDEYFNLICGKFLLESLCFYLRNIVGKKFKHEDFRWSLINNFDIQKLDYIKTIIKQAS